MKAHIYLNFDGNCAEAFDLYKSVFGGDFTMRTTFGESPMKDKMPEEYQKRLMHVQLPIGDNVDLMGCDWMPKMPNKKAYLAGTNTHVSIAPDSKEQADEIYDKLTADGGAKDLPMKEQFWGAYYGMCTDKYGIQWMINYKASDEGDKRKKHHVAEGPAEGETEPKKAKT